MKLVYRSFFVFLCAVVPAAALSAQERPLLTESAVRNFIKNYNAIEGALDALKDDADVSRMQNSADAFWEHFAEYMDDETDFSVLRGSYVSMRDIKSPKLDKVFSGNGMGGYRDFAVIATGIIILVLEKGLTEALEYRDSDFDAAGMRNKITRMRGLLHPADLTVLKNNLDALKDIL
jgi:hypothetical protein